ncbi:MAG TPA: condensation domain-containing protein [Rhodanobacter sp.]|nr:condensation domain-containing protein [Rhodanobacter sp.]
MHLSDLLLTLEYKQIELSVKNGSLGYKAPLGAFTDALLEEVKRHKQDLISLIERSSVQIEQWSSDDRALGELPLTPWHGWYLETFNPIEHRWSVTRHAHIGEDASFDLIKKAVHLTMNRYDTFRQRLYRKHDGKWSLRMLSTPGDPKIITCDVTENTEKWMRDIQKDVERTLSIVDGPVIHVALCKNKEKGDDIAVSLHHNIVDAYSVGSIMANIVDTYKLLSGHQKVDDKIKAECSYEDYAENLHNYMKGSMFLARSISYWSNFANTKTPRIPVDFVDGLHTANNSKIVTLYVGSDIVSFKNTSLINDSLLIATVAAIAHWSGHPMVAIDVEHHGRGGHIPGIDFLEVVGPTTFKFPMWFEMEPDSLSSPKSFEALRKRITDATQYGLGHGFLRYLHPDQGIRSDFRRMQRPQVFFNNRTTLFSKGGAQEKEGAAPHRKSGIFRIESHSDPELHDPYSHELLIECDSAQVGIEISLIYSEKIHKDRTIIELAETLLSKLQQISEACV